MQNPPIFPDGFKRRFLHIPKGPILHYFRTPNFGVSGGADRPFAGFVVSGHVNLCHFFRSPPGMGSPDPSGWVLVSHAVEIPDPQKGSRTSPKGVNSRGARFTFCAKPVFFTWFWQKWPNILLQTFAPPQICTVQNQANWSTRAREGIYKEQGICSHLGGPGDPYFGPFLSPFWGSGAHGFPPRG